MTRKNIKRIRNLFLTAVIAVCSFVTPIFAQEEVLIENDAVVQEVDVAETEVDVIEPGIEVVTFEIPVEAAEEGIIAVPRAIDQTFTMTTSHRGADRTYSANKLWYVVTITDANGNAVNNTVRVSLNDYNNGAISSMDVAANGSNNGHDVPITPGRTYYFTYNKIAGTTRTLKVRMYIEAHN